MHLTTTASWEVAQMLMSATRELGLGREAWAASSVLRARTGPECPEDNLRELTWDSNPNCGIAKETHIRTKKPFMWKALMHSQVHSQNKGLSKYQRRASWLHVGSSPPRVKEAGMWQPEPEGKGLLHSQPQRAASSTKLWAGSQLLTTSSWDPGWLTSARRVTAWDQLPRGDTQHTIDGAVMVHPENWVSGTREVIKMHGSPGTGHSQSTWPPELLQPGKGTKHAPNRACALAEYPRTWTSLDLGSVRSTGPTWDSALAEHPGAWAV